MSDRELTRAVRAALAKRYCPPEWAAFAEVPASTGATAPRSADLVAMSCYPSRGLTIHGIEIKASRADWRRELKAPDKADAIARYCDRWYVAAPKGIVPVEELPETWGLLELCGSGLRIKKEAAKMPAAALERPFVAALLRRAAAQASGNIRDRVAAEVERHAGQLAEARKTAWDNKSKADRYDTLAANVAEFEKASGIEIGRRWDSAPIGAAVALIKGLGLSGAHSRLQGLLNSARTFANDCEKAVAELDPTK